MQLHPLNRSFTWRQPEPPYELITEAQAQAYRNQGGFVLADAFTPQQLDKIVSTLDEIEQTTNSALADVPTDAPSISRRDEIVFQAHLVLRSQIARQFATHGVFRKLCHDLIGGSVRLYWDQLVYKHSGTADEFPWHQDNGYNYVAPQQYLTCWVALSDASVDNGCPWIVPGQHVNGTLAHRWTPLGFDCGVGQNVDPEVEAEPVAMPLKAGSIAVFSSLTPHRTGPNVTKSTRKAYILQYAPDGAMVHPREGEPFAANDPGRQFLLPENLL